MKKRSRKLLERLDDFRDTDEIIGGLEYISDNICLTDGKVDFSCKEAITEIISLKRLLNDMAEEICRLNGIIDFNISKD